MWRPPAESYSWKPIESAPLDEDVALQVTDGRGKPYTLRSPSRLTAAGWVSSGKGTPLALKLAVMPDDDALARIRHRLPARDAYGRGPPLLPGLGVVSGRRGQSAPESSRPR
jgi:hypothetical protein